MHSHVGYSARQGPFTTCPFVTLLALIAVLFVITFSMHGSTAPADAFTLVQITGHTDVVDGRRSLGLEAWEMSAEEKSVAAQFTLDDNKWMGARGTLTVHELARRHISLLRAEFAQARFEGDYVPGEHIGALSPRCATRQWAARLAGSARQVGIQDEQSSPLVRGRVVLGSASHPRVLYKAEVDASGCRAVFFDLGVNSGDVLVHVVSPLLRERIPDRKLLDSLHAVYKREDEHLREMQFLFGVYRQNTSAIWEDTRDMCVLGIEGSGRWLDRTRQLEMELKKLTKGHVVVASSTAVAACSSHFSDESDFLQFAVDPKGAGVGSSANRVGKGRWAIEHSRALSVLQMLEAYEDVPVWFIKMDVEGSEYTLVPLLLASRILERHVRAGGRVVFFLEWHGSREYAKNRDLVPPPYSALSDEQRFDLIDEMNRRLLSIGVSVVNMS